MRTLWILLFILFLPLLSQALTPLSLTPLGLSLSGQNNDNEDGDFEFPPITLPVMDDSLVKTYTLKIIIIGSTGTLTGIGFVIFGLFDCLSLAEQGYFSYKSTRGLFFISAGIVISGISVAVLTPALDTFF